MDAKILSVRPKCSKKVDSRHNVRALLILCIGQVWTNGTIGNVDGWMLSPLRMYTTSECAVECLVEKKEVSNCFVNFKMLLSKGSESMGCGREPFVKIPCKYDMHHIISRGP